MVLGLTEEGNDCPYCGKRPSSIQGEIALHSCDILKLTIAWIVKAPV